MAVPTHTVTNQVPPLVAYDVYSCDRALTEGVARYAAPENLDEITTELGELGRSAGSAQARRWGEEANAHEPVLRTHDRYGNRIDEVDFHPSWHRLLGHAVGAGLTERLDPAGRPPAPGGGLHHLDAGGGRSRLSAVDDARGGPGAARTSRGWRRGLGAAADLPGLRAGAAGRRRRRPARCSAWA